MKFEPLAITIKLDLITLNVIKVIACYCCIVCASILFSNTAFAQKPVDISDNVSQHILSYGEISYLEDHSNKLTIDDILKPDVKCTV